MNNATTHAENDAAANDASKAGIPESEWMSAYHRNEKRIADLEEKNKLNPKYKIGDIISEFRGYHNIRIKDIIENPDGSYSYLMDSDEMKDGKVSTKELDNYVPEGNIPQEFKDNVSSRLSNIDPDGPSYGLFFLKENSNEFDKLNGYAVNSDVVAISAIFGINIDDVFSAKVDRTIEIGKRGSRKSFNEYMNIIREKYANEFKYIQEEINKYLGNGRQDSKKYISEYQNCGRLPF
jgi:hypothetical protein